VGSGNKKKVQSRNDREGFSRFFERRRLGLLDRESEWIWEVVRCLGLDSYGGELRKDD
jgi:hypothetical protein